MRMRRLDVGGSAALEGVVRDAEGGRAVVLTRRGRPRALVVPTINADAWAETLDLLRDPGLFGRIAKAESAIRRGRVTTLDAVFSRSSRRQPQ